jgi:predicted dehydrogenase
MSQRSANEAIRHAVIGTGGMGSNHARSFAAIPNCEVAALCDLDPTRLSGVAAKLPNKERVKTYDDYRRVLEDQSIDSVSIATCDHWHTPIALAALMAGKHVYVEKPCAHNIHEANLLVKAAAQYKKCVQHGTQRRSWSLHKALVKALREGVIGKVYTAKVINNQLREPIGRKPVSAPPAGVNYDRWLGPAPKHDFTENRWHYNWHWFWDYGTGDLGNDGIHHLDVARWGLGVGYPKAVICSGAQYFYNDDHETPDTQTVIYQYESCQILYEMRLWTNYGIEGGEENAAVFYGTEGMIVDGAKGITVTRIDKKPVTITGGKESNFADFIAAVRVGDPSKLSAPITEGAISAVLCHLGNIGTRLGNQHVEYDPVTQKITKCGGREAEANRLLTRTYRKGYELPYKG